MKVYAKLSDEDAASLAKWLIGKNMPYQNLNQRFADGTQMALLLKSMFPRKVELHNYFRCSSTELKIYNWETLNARVLARLNLQQNQTNIEAFAKAIPKAIDNFLFKIMQIDLYHGRPSDRNMRRNKRLKTRSTSEGAFVTKVATGKFCTRHTLSQDDFRSFEDEKMVVADLFKELDLE